MTPEQEFERELEIFRTEVESASQFFYAYLSIRAVAGDRRRVFRLLNETPLFWNTALGGLQTASFVVLARAFDVTKIERRVHLWQGSDDRLVPPVINKTIADRMPGAVWHPVEGAGRGCGRQHVRHRRRGPAQATLTRSRQSVVKWRTSADETDNCMSAGAR
jgi:pimeloyl-ACP methyl ester carboxylesterase